jgi:hypothetical protein
MICRLLSHLAPLWRRRTRHEYSAFPPTGKDTLDRLRPKSTETFSYIVNPFFHESDFSSFLVFGTIMVPTNQNGVQRFSPTGKRTLRRLRLKSTDFAKSCTCCILQQNYFLTFSYLAPSWCRRTRTGSSVFPLPEKER